MKTKAKRKFPRPTWDEYFMVLTMVVATRSSCRHVRCGCVIVLDKTILGIGYNGAPRGVANCLDKGCRKERLGFTYKNSLNSGLCLGIHAEMNALANMSRTIHRGATVYTTTFPCSSCAKTLLGYSISRLVYKREYDDEEKNGTAKKLFKEVGVKVEKLDLFPKRILEILFKTFPVKVSPFSLKEEKEISQLSKSFAQNL